MTMRAAQQGGSGMDPRPPVEGAGVGGHWTTGTDASGDNPNPLKGKPTDSQFLHIATNCYQGSTDYFDSSLRRTFIRALDQFHNRHPYGSRYHTDLYMKRSRLFRPKTRSMIRNMESAVALSFFSTDDVVQIDAANSNDPMQKLGALIKKEVMNYRLGQKAVHWFQSCIGGAQDAMTVGTVISKQEWVFKERIERYEVPMTDQQGNPVTDPGTGEPLMGQKEIRKVIRDHPRIKIIAAENFRVDPACDWMDPVNSSPYVVELIPMYVVDVMERMKPRQSGDEPEFRKYERGVVAAAAREDWDAIRQARDGRGRLDKYEQGAVTDYEICWVRLNIVNMDGDDWVYWTLADQLMLTDPKPITDVWAHGFRPYVMGSSIIESNRLYPAGIPSLMGDVQDAMNFLMNTRFDNIMLALNKRWFVRRGSGADLRALLRNVPGGAVVMNDPNADVRPVGTPDVTSSSYQEQDRLNQDADDLVGIVSTGTVQGAENLNETVGGMNLLQSNAGDMKQLMMRNISETWVEPVLQQLVELERFYESDMTVLSVAAAHAGVQDITQAFHAFMMPADVKCKVGFGNTSPVERVNKLTLALKTLFEANPELVQMADWAEITDEVMGAVGYDNGARFFPSLDSQAQSVPMSQYQALQQQMQALQQQIGGKTAEIQGRLQIEGMRTESRERIEQAKLMSKDNQHLREFQLKNMLANIQQQKVNLEGEIKGAANANQVKKLQLEEQALDQAYEETLREYQLQVATRVRQDRNHAAATALTGLNSANRSTGGAINAGRASAVRLPGGDQSGVYERNRYKGVARTAMP